ncbi:hypothetical protein BDY24DRAFT_403250 [Mrakia frigida]|uniref:uncharacterized protein n=1 Tax=Mrakia frigida TaxID=29902 RepID=UPI003FCC19B0
MSFLRSTVSRSIVQPLFAQRSASTLAEIKLIGRLARDPDFFKDKNDKDYISYTIAVDNPSSFGLDPNGDKKEPTTSFYRVAAFLPAQVAKLEKSFDDGQLGKGSLVHAIAAVEQAPMKDQVQKGSDGKEYPLLQFNLQHRSMDILLPSTAKRDEMTAKRAEDQKK